MSDGVSPSDLPAYLDLPPHLSAHKYFFVCTLTVAAWDTLVLTPRSWKLLKTDGWPPLKAFYYFLRWFMPIEFVIVGVAFFDSSWTQDMCRHFFLFEPICTAILMAVTSAVHVIRIHAISDKNRTVFWTMGALLAVQIVVTAICCGFYRSVPLLDGQGCIAGPKANWVGIYWLAPTLVYTLSCALAIRRSVKSRHAKPLSPWKLMLRDGLNLYASIWAVNMTNMLFWFIVTPEDDPENGTADTIKTIVTSMTAVITTTMTMRIILSVRGTLVNGGSYAGTSNSNSSASNSNSRNVGSRHTHPTAGVLQINSQRGTHHTYTIQAVPKPEPEWEQGGDQKSSIHGGEEAKEKEGSGLVAEGAVVGAESSPPEQGVKITVDREVK